MDVLHDETISEDEWDIITIENKNISNFSYKK